MMLTTGDVRWHRDQCQNEELYGDNCVEEKGRGGQEIRGILINKFTFLENPCSFLH